MEVPRGFTVLPEFLIDDNGRGWCGDDCQGIDGPHWKGQLPEASWGAVPKQPTNKRLVKAVFAPMREAIEELRRRTPSEGSK